MKSRRITHIARAFAIVAFITAMSSPIVRAQSNDSAAISKLLSEAKSHAVQAEEHAATLKSYTTSGLSWESHASQLNAMRLHINDLGRVAKELNDARSEGSPWQQVAIDRINPLLREMADQLTVTIKHLDAHKDQISMQQYRDYTAANYELSNRTAAMISDLVEYGKAKSKAESLERKLELPNSHAGS
jgi:hypothetical protein